ncbi:ZGRF1 protein, partial [Xiphorhynchus elegans]|nr:ZGRF1 protein [Xiphorhynchus elegans]
IFKQVLYTHQKTKKAKTWQDGVLRIRTGRNQATLFDDKGQSLETIFIKSQVAAGDDLESERYLITVEAVKVSEKPSEDQPRKAEAPAVDRNGVKPGLLPPRRLPGGLKRKFMGFQVPRQVEQKIPATEGETKPTLLPLSKQCQGTLPAKFYISSPLFATVHKKDADTNLSANSQEDGCREDDREHMSVSSLLAAPFINRCEGTEQQNSAQFAVKPQSLLITGQTGPGAVSHNIRSTAQILALLKAKPAQGHGEQTSAVTQSLSSFQAPKNARLCDQKGMAPPVFSGAPAKGVVPNIQHLPLATGTVNDKKDWNAEMSLNPAEQPCGEEATGQGQDKKVNNLSQDLQDHCNTNSCFLRESALSRMSDSQFVPSSGDISPLASLVTLENNPSGYRECSGTKDPREDSGVRMQSELQPRQNLEGVLSDLGLAVDVTLAEAGVTKEELKAAAQSAAQGPHSCCEGVTHSKNEVKCSAPGREKDGNDCTEGVFSELYENNVRDTSTLAEDSANQTKIEGELLGDEHNIKEINASQLGSEATSNSEDLDGCAALTTNGTLWIRSQHSDLLPGDTNVKEWHPEISMFEPAGSISGISPSRIISATDRNAEEGVTQFGCRESLGVGSEHFWGPRNDDIQPGSPLLALSQKSGLSSGSFQFTAEDHQKVFGVSQEEDALISKSSMHPLGTGHSTPEETTAETEFENAESVDASHETCRGERTGVDCLECSAVAENSSGLPDLVNDIALLRALTQHSTALESLQKMEENNSLLCE